MVSVLSSFISVLNAVGYWQHSNDQYNLLKHCGGMGPYVEGTGFGLSHELPANTTVDQVYVFSRHGERFPTVSVAEELRAVYNKLKAAQVEEYKGPLAFVRDWEFYIPNDDCLEMETNTSRFSGLLDMENFGRAVRRKYGYLYKDETELPFFSAGQQRVVDSATSFAKGFFGSESEFDRLAHIHVIPEKAKQGANTLTSGRSCKPYNKHSNYDSGLKEFETQYLSQEADRLNSLSPGFDLNAQDVQRLLAYCPFELNYRGHSEVCQALSFDSFVGHEYSRDLELYYTKALHPFSFILGSLYVNATLTLFEQGSDQLNQSLWFSFSHDTDLLYFMNALGILDHQATDLSLHHIDFARWFRTSELIPMGARIVLERIKDSTGQVYVRVLVNDAVIPIPKCTEGPGYSCPLAELRKIFDSRLDGDTFASKCHVKSRRPWHLSFYWDWNTK
ncbi:hypothetical protein OGAPHI_005076 [Ogataea philodendri]|uniref:Acid phosphatase n=1 Tax=Ogataea philodendri TaxID=1378263 RepID=A0A9P8P1Q4_9ASCO|nr:uncharacterized protein OGAPHI_005076 [Ogataea philodendri]KAH3663675.1 hypothetical protein OGAPHI_005076 [Ogataea philodendri]